VASFVVSGSNPSTAKIDCWDLAGFGVYTEKWSWCIRLYWSVHALHFSFFKLSDSSFHTLHTNMAKWFQSPTTSPTLVTG
jgi:hypothetical protein